MDRTGKGAWQPRSEKIHQAKVFRCYVVSNWQPVVIHKINFSLKTFLNRNKLRINFWFEYYGWEVGTCIMLRVTVDTQKAPNKFLLNMNSKRVRREELRTQMMRPYLPRLQILADIDHSSEDRGLHNDTNRSDFFPQ